MLESIPQWLLGIHGQNYSDLLNCKNNPSPRENRIAIKLIEEILPNSDYSDFRFIVMNEWIVHPNRLHLGKGDLVMTNGKNLLVIEIKSICSQNHQIKLKGLLKVIRQARYYGTVIKKFRDFCLFHDYRLNVLFRHAKVHCAFFTNFDSNIVLLNKVTQKNLFIKDKNVHLKGITVEEIYEKNILEIQDIASQENIRKNQEEQGDDDHDGWVDVEEISKDLDHKWEINANDGLDNLELLISSEDDDQEHKNNEQENDNHEEEEKDFFQKNCHQQQQQQQEKEENLVLQNEVTAQTYNLFVVDKNEKQAVNNNGQKKYLQSQSYLIKPEAEQIKAFDQGQKSTLTSDVPLKRKIETITGYNFEIPSWWISSQMLCSFKEINCTLFQDREQIPDKDMINQELKDERDREYYQHFKKEKSTSILNKPWKQSTLKQLDDLESWEKNKKIVDCNDKINELSKNQDRQDNQIDILIQNNNSSSYSQLNPIQNTEQEDNMNTVISNKNHQIVHFQELKQDLQLLVRLRMVHEQQQDLMKQQEIKGNELKAPEIVESQLPFENTEKVAEKKIQQDKTDQEKKDLLSNKETNKQQNYLSSDDSDADLKKFIESRLTSKQKNEEFQGEIQQIEESQENSLDIQKNQNSSDRIDEIESSDYSSLFNLLNPERTQTLKQLISDPARKSQSKKQNKKFWSLNQLKKMQFPLRRFSVSNRYYKIQSKKQKKIKDKEKSHISSLTNNFSTETPAPVFNSLSKSEKSTLNKDTLISLETKDSYDLAKDNLKKVENEKEEINNNKITLPEILLQKKLKIIKIHQNQSDKISLSQKDNQQQTADINKHTQKISQKLIKIRIPKKILPTSKLNETHGQLIHPKIIVVSINTNKKQVNKKIKVKLKKVQKIDKSTQNL